MGLSVPWACLREWGKGGAVEMTIKKRNYLWIILLKPEQGGHQGLLEWHVPLWRGSLAEMKGEGGGGNEVSAKEGIFVDTEKKRVRRLSRTYWNRFYLLKGVWSVVMKANAEATERGGSLVFFILLRHLTSQLS